MKVEQRHCGSYRPHEAHTFNLPEAPWSVDCPGEPAAEHVVTRSVEIPEAVARVAEFVRQRERMGGQTDLVYTVHADPDAEAAPLLLDDLRALAALPYLAPADDGGNHHWDHDVQQRPNAGPVHICLTCPEKRACTGPSCGLHSILLGERTGENALAEWLEYVFTTNEDTVTWEAAAKELFDCGAIREPAGDEVVHLIADGEAVTSCCGRTPFALPRTDRLTVDPKLASGCAPVGDGGLREALEKLAEEYADELGTVSYQWLSEKTLKPLLAAHPAAPAVNREALLMLLHDQNCDCEILKPLRDFRPEQFLEQRRRHAEYYGEQADAVLAVLAGEQVQVQ